MPSTLTVLGVRKEKVTTSTLAGSRRLYINSPLLLLFPVFCVFKFLANQNRMNLTIICTIYSYWDFRLGHFFVFTVFSLFSQEIYSWLAGV